MHLLAGCGQMVLARFSNDTLPYPLSSYKRSVLGFRTSLVAVGTLVNPAPPAQIRTGSITAYGSYLGYLASKRCFTHIEQVARRAGPALRPGRGRLPDVLLGRSPSLHTLRRWLSTVVRALRRYYATVRLPIGVRVGLLAQGLLQPARHTFHDGRRWGLPVLARGVSIHAWGLRLRGVLRMLAIAHPSVLPSAMRNDVGTPVAIISQLNTQPACAPVNASPAALRLPTHDSGPGWLATPFLCDSFIHNSTPVYPGAPRILLDVPSRAWLLRPYGALQTTTQDLIDKTVSSRRAGRFGSLKTRTFPSPSASSPHLRGEGGKRPDAERSGANQ